MLKFVRVICALFALLITASTVDARGGGYNTTFDINSEGGNWTCFRTVGVCGAGFAQYWNATCDGVTSDATAQAAWLSYGHGLGAAQAKLYVPPGSNCILDFSNTSLTADLAAHNGIQNVLVWAYATNWSQTIFFGGWGYPNAFNGTTAQTALFQTVSAGSQTVTLTTLSDIANIATWVNKWVAVTGFTIQTFGNPSQTYFEYKLITAINTGTGVLTLDSPLANSYKSTWPQLDPGDASNYNQGGPGTIYLMDPTWNTNTKWMGGRLTTTTDFQPAVRGKNVVVQDVQFGLSSNVNQSASKDLWLINSGLGNSEVDKNIQALWMINTTNSTIAYQNESVNSVIQGGSTSRFINGLGKTMAISNHTVGGTGIRAGSLSLSLDGLTFATPTSGVTSCPISSFSFSAGTLTIAKANYDCSSHLWVPGAKYFLGDAQGFSCSRGGGPTAASVAFTVTDVVDAGANVQIVTDLSSIPAGNLCQPGSVPYSSFAAFQTQTYSAKFSGPANFTSNPEFLAP